jgi:hypothetical protein
METREVCEFSYRTSLGRTRVVRIPDPLPVLSAANVSSAAGLIRTAQPFNPETVGTLEELLSAERVRTVRTPLIAPSA